jgi:hypothetical protein
MQTGKAEYVLRRIVYWLGGVAVLVSTVTAFGVAVYFWQQLPAMGIWLLAGTGVLGIVGVVGIFVERGYASIWQVAFWTAFIPVYSYFLWDLLPAKIFWLGFAPLAYIALTGSVSPYPKKVHDPNFRFMSEYARRMRKREGKSES